MITLAIRRFPIQKVRQLPMAAQGSPKKPKGIQMEPKAILVRPKGFQMQPKDIKRELIKQ